MTFTFKKFNAAKTHYIEVDPKSGLCYVCESKGNVLLQICSIKEIKKMLETMK